MKKYKKLLFLSSFAIAGSAAVGPIVVSCSSNKPSGSTSTPPPPAKKHNTIFKTSNSYELNKTKSGEICENYLKHFNFSTPDVKAQTENLINKIYTQNVNLYEFMYYTIPVLYNYLYNPGYADVALPFDLVEDANYSRSGLADIFYCDMDRIGKKDSIDIVEFKKNNYKEYSLIFDWNNSYWFKPDGSKMDLNKILKINFDQGFKLGGQEYYYVPGKIFYKTKPGIFNGYDFDVPAGVNPIEYTNKYFSNPKNRPVDDKEQFVKFSLTMTEYWKDGQYITDHPYTWEYTLYGNWVITRESSYSFSGYSWAAACSLEPSGFLKTDLNQNTVYWNFRYKVAEKSYFDGLHEFPVARLWKGFPNKPE